MARLPDPTPTLDEQGRAIYQKLAGPRGGLHGMYLALMNNPNLADNIGNLGTVALSSPFFLVSTSP